MDPKQTTGEATPAKNTAKINPATFDQAALTERLKVSLGVSEAVKPEEITPPVEPAADAVPEPEAPADQPGEADEPAGEELPAETEGEEPRETDSKGVQKRIDKLTAQKKEALERAEAAEASIKDLEGRLHDLESAPPAVTPSESPFGNIWEEAKLRDEWSKARQLKRWCEDNPDGAEVNGHDYTSEQVRSIRRNVEDALEVGIPQRAAFLQQYRQLKPLAEQIYPFWKDRNSKEYGEAQVILRQLPALQTLPEYQVLIGDFMTGRAVRQAKKAAEAKPAVMPRKAPKQPSTPSAAPVRHDDDKAQYESAKKQFLKTQNPVELARLLLGRV